MSRLRSGFTVLEILIVIAVFGLVVTLGAVSLNSSRARVRDTQRLSDISVLRAGLSQHWLEKAVYPTSDGVSLAQPGTGTEILTADGFAPRGGTNAKVYLDRVPFGPKSNEYYRYRGGTSGYSIRFRTERETIYGPANIYYAHSDGIDRKDELR